MAHELTAFVNWFGVLAGTLGVLMAIYLQLINPRRCDPKHVTALFAAGSAQIMVFAGAWTNGVVLLTLKTVAVLMFVALEVSGAYYVWKHAEAAPPHEVIASFFKDGNGGPA